MGITTLFNVQSCIIAQRARQRVIVAPGYSGANICGSDKGSGRDCCPKEENELDDNSGDEFVPDSEEWESE